MTHYLIHWVCFHCMFFAFINTFTFLPQLSMPFENAHKNRGAFVILNRRLFLSFSHPHVCICLSQLTYLLGVWVGLHCGVCVAQWGSRWAPTGPSSLAVADRWGLGCLPSAQDCPGWWDSPLLAPSSSTPREELQPERMSLKTFKGRKWWRGYKLALYVGNWFFVKPKFFKWILWVYIVKKSNENTKTNNWLIHFTSIACVANISSSVP